MVKVRMEAVPIVMTTMASTESVQVHAPNLAGGTAPLCNPKYIQQPASAWTAGGTAPLCHPNVCISLDGS
eukprot:7039653-Pyramimonas_sp.AAC.1